MVAKKKPSVDPQATYGINIGGGETASIIAATDAICRVIAALGIYVDSPTGEQAMRVLAKSSRVKRVIITGNTIKVGAS